MFRTKKVLWFYVCNLYIYLNLDMLLYVPVYTLTAKAPEIVNIIIKYFSNIAPNFLFSRRMNTHGNAIFGLSCVDFLACGRVLLIFFTPRLFALFLYIYLVVFRSLMNDFFLLFLSLFCFVFM